MKITLALLIMLSVVGCKRNKIMEGSELPDGCVIETVYCPQVTGKKCPKYTLVCEDK